MNRLLTWFEELSEREQKLLGVMLVVVSLGVFLVASFGISSAFEKVDAQNERLRGALDAVLQQRDTFRSRAAAAQLAQSKLETNTLRLSSFIEARATRLGLASPRGFTDRQTPREDGITAFETTAQFQGLDLTQLDQLLNEFRNTDELVYIQEVQVDPSRARTTTGLDVRVTLVTYRRTVSDGGDP